MLLVLVLGWRVLGLRLSSSKGGGLVSHGEGTWGVSNYIACSQEMPRASSVQETTNPLWSSECTSWQHLRNQEQALMPCRDWRASGDAPRKGMLNHGRAGQRNPGKPEIAVDSSLSKCSQTAAVWQIGAPGCVECPGWLRGHGCSAACHGEAGQSWRFGTRERGGRGPNFSRRAAPVCIGTSPTWAERNAEATCSFADRARRLNKEPSMPALVTPRPHGCGAGPSPPSPPS